LVDFSWRYGASSSDVDVNRLRAEPVDPRLKCVRRLDDRRAAVHFSSTATGQRKRRAVFAGSPRSADRLPRTFDQLDYGAVMDLPSLGRMAGRAASLAVDDGEPHTGKN